MGHQVEIAVKDGFDGYGQRSYYHAKILTPKNPSLKRFGFLGKIIRFSIRSINVVYFYVSVTLYSRKFDFVHIHTYFLLTFFITKPKLIEFHGDDIRHSPTKKGKLHSILTQLFLDIIKKHYITLISTPDLKEDLPEAIYLPNPVDTELFTRQPHYPLQNAVYFLNWHEKINNINEGVYLAKAIAFKYGVNLKIIDRTAKSEIISYPQMPKFINQFDMLIDRQYIPSLSKTALEALACGLLVVDYNRKEYYGLPYQHCPEVVANQTINIYKAIMK